MFIGVSAGRVPEHVVATMADDAIVFALANPEPEVSPDVAARYAAVVATGRSDFPNQINNVLAFPGVFRGALDVRATRITARMKVAAAEAIAGVVGTELSPDHDRPEPVQSPRRRRGGRPGGCCRPRRRSRTAVARRSSCSPSMPRRSTPPTRLSGLVIGERPGTRAPRRVGPIVQVRAASVNHHDVWTLRGVGITDDRLPMILGCDAAGVDDAGNPVLVHSVIADPSYDDESMDPGRSLLSEVHPGTFADFVAVPTRNLLPLPPGFSFAEAACLPTAWLTAYRMLATRSGLEPGDTILVQGAGGGVATACIMLGRLMGYRVWVTSRDAAKRDRALQIGAHEAFPAGARLPYRVDAVMETVGAATWDHSLKSLRPGGRIVISGATSGANPPADLTRVFFKQLEVVGSTMGTRNELRRLVSLLELSATRPLISRELPMERADEALRAVADGDVFGKIVLTR